MSVLDVIACGVLLVAIFVLGMTCGWDRAIATFTREQRRVDERERMKRAAARAEARTASID